MPPVLSKLFSTLPSGIWVKLVELVASFGPRAFSSLSNGARVRMIDALHRILRYLQNGFDVGWQYSVSAPSTRIAIATLILANVFEPWARAGWAPRSAEELTEMSGSGADVELISELYCSYCDGNIELGSIWILTNEQGGFWTRSSARDYFLKQKTTTKDGPAHGPMIS